MKRERERERGAPFRARPFPYRSRLASECTASDDRACVVRTSPCRRNTKRTDRSRSRRGTCSAFRESCFFRTRRSSRLEGAKTSNGFRGVDFFRAYASQKRRVRPVRLPSCRDIGALIECVGEVSEGRQRAGFSSLMANARCCHCVDIRTTMTQRLYGRRAHNHIIVQYFKYLFSFKRVDRKTAKQKII